jgi:tetratricopeptide (TPR) repeat protein
MSPEQYEVKDLDARSDIFSLGAVLYEMSTGKPAFTGSSVAEVRDNILHRTPPPIVTRKHGALHRLERIVRKAIAKEPAERYQNAEHLLADLRALRIRLAGRRRRRVVATAVGALILVGAATLSVLGVRSTTRPLSMEVGLFGTPHDQTQLEHFRDGLSETIMAHLSGLKGVYVVPSREDFQGDLVLEGGVQELGGSIRVTYHLQHRGEDRSLGGGLVEERSGNAFILQDEVASDIAALLRAEFGLAFDEASVERPTRNVTAFDYYLRGREYLRNHGDLAGVNQALEYFRRSVSRDPEFAEAHAALGGALSRKFEITNDKSLARQAERACQRAASIRSKSADAQVCLGEVHLGLGRYGTAAEEFLAAIEADPTNDDAYLGLGKAHEALGNPEAAEKAYLRAIDLHPDYWGGYNYLARFYSNVYGRYAAAAEQFERAVDLAPGDSRSHLGLGGCYLYMGRYEEAVDSLRNSIDINPTFGALSNLGLAHFSLRRFEDAIPPLERAVGIEEAKAFAFGNLGKAYYWAPGQRDKARATFERAIRIGEAELEANPHDSDAHVLLSEYYAMIGNRAEALEHLQAALDALPEHPHYLYSAGLVHNQLGESEEAIHWLERAVDEGYSTAEMRTNVELDNLRGDARFQGLVSRR